MKPRQHNSPSSPPAPGRVRIIGGQLRGSRLEVPPIAGLRPSSDRVRETLFNWLAPHIAGARCIDLFAGSGALGFEAASRGAASVLMIERDARAAASLAASVARLGADAVQVRCGDAFESIRLAAEADWDIAFVDPPFDAGLLDASLVALDARLAPQALVYVECRLDASPAIPPQWRLHRQGTTREVRYSLYLRPA